MKASKKLIAAMRATAEKLENTNDAEDYNHTSCAVCNIGNLAQVVMNVTPDTLVDILFENQVFGYYRDTSYYYLNICEVTNLPLPLIFRELAKVGITDWEDYAEIENAANTKEQAIEYFRAKADQLETQLT